MAPPPPTTRQQATPLGGLVDVLTSAWTFYSWQAVYWEVGALLPLLQSHSFYPAYDLALDDAIRAAEHRLFGFEPAADLHLLFGSDTATRRLLSEALHAIYFSFVPLIVASCVCFRAARPLRPWSSAFETNVTAAYCACALWWLCLPVFGPAVTIGPPMARDRLAALPPLGSSAPASPSSSKGAATAAVAAHVWGVGKRFASVGTALPSSHCAVSTAMLLAVHLAATEAAALRAVRRGVARLLMLAYALLVGTICFSTVYCGFHYVADVVTGVGLAVGVCAAAGGANVAARPAGHSEPPAAPLLRKRHGAAGSDSDTEANK